MYLSGKTSLTFVIFLVASSLSIAAVAGEPDWWKQKKADCGLPSNLAYNDWVTQKFPCPSAGSGGSGTTSSDPAVQAAHTLGGVIGQTLVQSIQQIAAERERRLRQMADEKRMAEERENQRLTEQARNDSHQKQLALEHLQGVLRFSDPDTPVGNSVPNTGALPSNSAKDQLVNSTRETTGQLFDNGRGPSDAAVSAPQRNDATPSAQDVPTFVQDKRYLAAAAEVTKAQVVANEVNKKLADLQGQQAANPTPQRQIEIFNLSAQANQANGAVVVATNNLDTVKKKIIESGPAIIVDDNPPDSAQTKPAPDNK